jgi:hypothetical protein
MSLAAVTAPAKARCLGNSDNAVCLVDVRKDLTLVMVPIAQASYPHCQCGSSLETTETRRPIRRGPACQAHVKVGDRALVIAQGLGTSEQFIVWHDLN